VFRPTVQPVQRQAILQSSATESRPSSIVSNAADAVGVSPRRSRSASPWILSLLRRMARAVPVGRDGHERGRPAGERPHQGPAGLRRQEVGRRGRRRAAGRGPANLVAVAVASVPGTPSRRSGAESAAPPRAPSSLAPRSDQRWHPLGREPGRGEPRQPERERRSRAEVPSATLMGAIGLRRLRQYRWKGVRV
jgi:hypothetical protein